MIFKHKKDMIHFSGRRHPKTGICSAIIGIIVVLGFLALSIVSGLAKGNGSFIIGIIGMVLFFLAVAGFLISYKSFKKKDIFYHFPIAGAVLNGVMMILLMVIYLMGI